MFSSTLDFAIHDDTDGKNIITISKANNDITFHADAALIINNLTASKLVETDGSKNLQSVSDLTGHFTGGTNISITGTDPTQAMNTGDSPQFTGLALTGTLTVNTINEYTTDAGVIIELTQFENGEIHINNDTNIYIDEPTSGYLGFHNNARYKFYGDATLGDSIIQLNRTADTDKTYISFTEGADVGLWDIGMMNDGQDNFVIKNLSGNISVMTILQSGNDIEFASQTTLKINSLTASKLVETDGSKNLQSVSDLTGHFTGGTNISITGTDPLTINFKYNRYCGISTIIN
jgi:hypothetical protein